MCASESVMSYFLCAWSDPKTGFHFSGSCARPVAVFPAQEWRSSGTEQPVGGFADYSKHHNGRDDLRRLAELLAVDQQITEPLGGPKQFGGDDEHPAKPKARAQR